MCCRKLSYPPKRIGIRPSNSAVSRLVLTCSPSLAPPPVPLEVERPSAIPKLDICYYARLAVGSACRRGLSRPHPSGFSGAKSSKKAPLPTPRIITSSDPPLPFPGYHELTKPTCAGRTPSRSSVTRLSYPASLTGCPVRSRRFQVSPHRPVGFHRPQQPSCGASVRPFRAAHRRDSHPLSQVPGTSRHCLLEPVSLSPNTPEPCAPRSPPGPDRVEGGIAASSALRSRASPIRGTRLQQHTPAAIGDRGKLASQGLGRPGVT
jgi:hypothetical protein